jgi:putative SOS response-associated peptidase YedK
MCKKFVLASELEKIEIRFNVHINPNVVPIPKLYSISTGDCCYVITNENPHELKILKFGITPFYAIHPMDLINARSEGDKNMKNDPCYNGSMAIFLQTAFKKPIQSQRCLVIADAYYEWSDRNKPYLVYLQNKNRPFAFAGI